jgi:putative transposase
LSNFQNSYTRYFYTVHRRDGSLFLNQFKAVEVETEAQLLHLSRYIHLNPYTASLIEDLDNLGGYPWSSLKNYLGDKNDNFIENEIVISLFGSPEQYKRFVFDYADYGRNLKRNEKLWLDFLDNLPG